MQELPEFKSGVNVDDLLENRQRRKRKKWDGAWQSSWKTAALYIKPHC